jgi:hypothetical protein
MPTPGAGKVAPGMHRLPFVAPTAGYGACIGKPRGNHGNLTHLPVFRR